MSRRGDATRYRDKFNAWKADRLKRGDFLVKGSNKIKKGDSYEYEFTKEEFETLTQCYCNKGATQPKKFAKVRSKLPIYWFVSKFGTIVSFEGKSANEPKVLKGSFNAILDKDTGEYKDGRFQFDVDRGKKRVSLDPATIVALTFGGKASPEAEKLLNDKGIKALRRKSVQELADVELHHEEGYIHSNNEEEARKNLQKNCDYEKTKFETKQVHILLTHPPHTRTNATEDDYIRYFKAMGENMPQNKPSMLMFNSNKKHTGRSVEDIKFEAGKDGSTMVNWSESTEITCACKVGDVIVEVTIVDENGTPLIKGDNISTDDADKIEKEFHADPIRFASYALETWKTKSPLKNIPSNKKAYFDVKILH